MSRPCPATHPARLMPPGELLFMGRACNLRQRLDALAAVAAARVTSQQVPGLQDVDAAAPGYTPGLSKAARR